jgi:glycosyltransferase involved in cell wall biosynthesis
VNKELPLVSLILVVRNSEIHIERAIQSYLNQDYPLSRLELIIVDGMSEDTTLTKINKLKCDLEKKIHSLLILNNSNKILATGWNIAIKHASGEYVCRIDVHSEISSDYISSAIRTLSVPPFDIMGVGGVLKNHSLSKFGQIACDFYGSKFGVGNSPFRIDQESGIVESDTAVFAVYRRALFLVCGSFNEELARNQDIEFHQRIRLKGFKLVTDYSLKCNYFVRSSFTAFIKKAYNDGFWVVKSNSYYLRHLIPLLFTVFIIFIFLLSFVNMKFLYLLLPYFILSLFFSFKDASKIKNKILLNLLYPTYHASYGIGSLLALLKGIKK